jgi:hypothetical protein
MVTSRTSLIPCWSRNIRSFFVTKVLWWDIFSSLSSFCDRFLWNNSCSCKGTQLKYMITQTTKQINKSMVEQKCSTLLLPRTVIWSDLEQFSSNSHSQNLSPKICLNAMLPTFQQVSSHIIYRFNMSYMPTHLQVYFTVLTVLDDTCKSKFLIKNISC